MIITGQKQRFFDFNLIFKKAGLCDESTIADCGCGQWGYFSFLALPFAGGGKIYAVDLRHDFLENVKNIALWRKVENIQTVLADLENYQSVNIPTASVDSVLIVNTIHQINKKNNTAREALRVLKTGACVIVVDWRMDAYFGPNVEYRIQQSHLKHIFGEAGFRFKEEFIPGRFNYGLVFEKG